MVFVSALLETLLVKSGWMSSLMLLVSLFLQLAVSSDKMASLHIPLLSLSFSVKENGVLQPVTVEMDREELNLLIGSLDGANKVGVTL